MSCVIYLYNEVNLLTTLLIHVVHLTANCWTRARLSFFGVLFIVDELGFFNRTSAYWAIVTARYCAQ